jgi:hypothetical protein
MIHVPIIMFIHRQGREREEGDEKQLRYIYIYILQNMAEPKSLIYPFA